MRVGDKVNVVDLRDGAIIHTGELILSEVHQVPRWVEGKWTDESKWMAYVQGLEAWVPFACLRSAQ